MGRLVMAHHKSYHPYKRENIERVRRDEEEARLKEAKEEGRLMLADSEARIDRLRDRVGAFRSRKGKEKEEEVLGLSKSMPPPAIGASGGHINFFEDLEQNAIVAAVRASRTKKDELTEDDKGVRLAPSQADRNPWYTVKQRGLHEKQELDEKQRRDVARKSAHDPLTSITQQLSSRPSAIPHSHPSRISSSSSSDPQQARLSRESSERERALALIRRKRREMEGSETPSTVCEPDYRDMYNRKEVEEAHRGRGEYWRRRWDDDYGPSSNRRSRGR